MNNEELQALLEYVDEKKKDKALLEFQLKQINEDITKSELMLQRYLEDNKIKDYKQCGIYSFGWKVTTSNRFNQSAFSEAHPDLFEQFKQPTESRKFQVLINR